jgi:sugar O-acyltransferase (sialic acid O-acetyltransferase NeuD family)
LASDLGEVVGGIDSVIDHIVGDDVRLVLGVGLPRTKEKLVASLAPLDLPWATVVHPQTAIGPNVSIGEGSYIAAGSIITVNARIGRFATVNLHCQVAHDDILGDLVTLHPDVHLSGNVTIGTGCELGTGSIVIPGTSIGEWAVLGAGSVTIAPLPGGQTYVGIPARPLVRVGTDRSSHI